jgi:hypothetical protein
VSAPTPRAGHRRHPRSFEYDGLLVGVLAGGEHRRSAAIRSAIREAFQQGRIAPDISGAADAMKGGVALVGGGPGDPELITVRAGGRWPTPTSSSRTGWRHRTAGRTGPARRGHRRRQDPVRAGDGAGGDQRGPDRAGPRRAVRRAA